MQVGTTNDQGLYNKPSAAVHPGAVAAGTLPQYNTIFYLYTNPSLFAGSYFANSRGRLKNEDSSLRPCSTTRTGLPAIPHDDQGVEWKRSSFHHYVSAREKNTKTFGGGGGEFMRGFLFFAGGLGT